MADRVNPAVQWQERPPLEPATNTAGGQAKREKLTPGDDAVLALRQSPDPMVDRLR
jgi:hypothetical protein